MNDSAHTDAITRLAGSLFTPQAVAVIGASNSKGNLGATICAQLAHLGYAGKVYVVNRSGDSVHGFPGRTSVGDIPDPVDSAIIITPARMVPQTARECGAKGVRTLIVESAGFDEQGDEGAALKKDLDAVVREYGMRYIGPNCLGVLDAHSRFISFFGIQPGVYDHHFDKPGPVSYVSQSGGVVTMVLSFFRSDIINVCKMASIGNRGDIDESDMMMLYESDDLTSVICLYVENIHDGRRFFDTASRVKKPVLLFKGGRSPEGARAAQSHTAGMANNDTVFEHACRQAGIIILRSVTELSSMPKVFVTMPLLRGKNIAIFTNSGAFGSIMSDLLVSAGLGVPLLPPETTATLEATGVLYNASNPVDCGPATTKQIFQDIFRILLESPAVDGLLLAANMWKMAIIEAAKELPELCVKYRKPAIIYVPSSTERIITLRKEHGMPIYETPEEAVRALEVSLQQYRISLKKKVQG